MDKLIITYLENKICTALLSEGRVVQMTLESKEHPSRLNNIYIGKVQKLVPSIQAAFVDIAPGTAGYYSLAENMNHHFVSAPRPQLKPGDEIVVQVVRDEVKTKAPVLSGSIRGEVVCLWEETGHMCDFPEALRNLRQIREWNLLFDRGSLIRRRDVEEMEIVPLKYPAALESQLRRAMLAEDGEEIKKCYYRLYDLFRAEPHSPRDIKECLIRFNLSVLGAYKTRYEVKSELSVQHSMHLIAEAISWKQVRTAMQDFFDVMEFNAFGETGDAELSDLVRKAVQLVRKHYDQGIRLEEIASRLFVSEEYLSAQFKKETGMGFAETVRMLRIERIKSLLAGTRLKLNQIAELTGYTDPKYMSRVFKEEVGMLPTEFRKMIH